MPFNLTVWGRFAHLASAGPPTQLSFTFPLKLFTDFNSRRNAARTPRKAVCVGGLALIVKLVAGAGDTTILPETGSAGE